MNWGDFREYFRGFAWKRLTAHEVDPKVSNGHEFQGVGKLRALLGTASADRLPTTYVLLRDDPADSRTLHLWSKWYDSRANDPRRSAEWRLYYPAEAGEIQSLMNAQDLMVLAVTRQGKLVIFLATCGSESEQKLVQLFAIANEGEGHLEVREYSEPVSIDFVSASLLEELGLARAHAHFGREERIVDQLIDELTEKYPLALPFGHQVSELIRRKMIGVDALGSPDEALMGWIEAEAAVFRGWEDKKIATRLRLGFNNDQGDPDVEAFRSFSMSLRQSRVSRAGGALQYHFRALLDAHRIRYVMEPRIDSGEIPDFLFPSKVAYEDPAFPSDQLRMLAAKFTAKDRWRQVLNEAKRIDSKHLLTLEPSISANQVRLMDEANLTLVMPRSIRDKYLDERKASIESISEFLAELSLLQKR